MLKRIILFFKMGWFGFCNPQLLTGEALTPMAKILELALTVTDSNCPRLTHLYMGYNRVASFWVYPGLSKNPVDRIDELVKEVDALKVAAQQTSENISNEEPLGYLDRKKLQLNILKNIEQRIFENEENSELESWWNSSSNWVKVQTFINGRSKKAGSTSSIAQCRYIGIDPDSNKLD